MNKRIVNTKTLKGSKDYLSLYRNQTAFIRKQRVEEKLAKGVRRGCVLPPLLFNICMDDAMKEL